MDGVNSDLPGESRGGGDDTHGLTPLGPISTSYPYPLPFNPIYFKLVSFNSLQLLLHYLKQPIWIRFFLNKRHFYYMLHFFMFHL